MNGKGGTFYVWLAVFAVAFAVAPGRLDAALIGVTAVPEETPYVLGDEPVTLLLSKSRYPAEDRHLDAIVWLTAPDGARADGSLEVSLHDEQGATRARDAIRPLPGERVFFSLVFPADMAGRHGSVRVVWVSGDQEIGRAEQSFAVLPATGVSTSGRIRLRVPNAAGAVWRGVPVTVGVPFPRGALTADANVRLADADGQEIPLQTRVTSRWSRFGSIRWMQCDFAVDVDGRAREVFLEYGPNVTRSASEGLRLTYPDLSHGALPMVHAGAVRFGENGIEFDAGDGRGHRQIVAPEGLSGAFVEHENGKVFHMPAGTPWEIEEQGAQKIVLRRRGWYVLPGTEERFCRFDTRYVVRYGSPLVRVLHTWVFTGYPYEDLYTWPTARRIELSEGKGDADRIRDMGWRFELANALKPAGFLSSFGKDGVWREGDYLLQHDYDKSEVVAAAGVAPGARAAGVAAAAGGEVSLLLGVKDFWQNFPNELEFAGGALYFHQWPRHGRPAGTHPPRVADGMRLWFAHEGEVLDFAVPKAYTDAPDFQKATPNRFHLHGFRQTINAQGVAKTAEMWLLPASAALPADEQAGVLAGLNDGTLRAMVDPTWVAGSGAFYEMHPRDVEKYPEAERIYEMHAVAPLTWIERMRFYGKWIWGDMWWGGRLRERDWTVEWGSSQGLYRGCRKSHQGWPYSWIPFARSGDVRFWRLADAATRHMADVVFCHYSDERVPPWRAGSREENPVRPRWRGFHIRYHIPWAGPSYDCGSRDYTDKNNYLWHGYYLTGYPRARDVAMDWAQLCKTEGSARWASRGDVRTVFTGPLSAYEAARQSVTMLQSFVEQYQATFDPWFLAAAHQTARNQLRWFREDGWRGHFWNSGPREFHRFTGSEEYAEFYLAYARHMTQQHDRYVTGAWAACCGMIEPAAYGYLISRDDFLLRRASGWLDYTRLSSFDGEPSYYRGTVIRHGGRNAGPMYTGYFLQYFPYALGAFERAGAKPEPLPSGFFQLGSVTPRPEDQDLYAYGYRLALRKEAGKPVPLRLHIQQRLWTPDPDFKEVFRYRVVGPDGRTALQGEWNVKAPTDVVIPAAAPAGVFRVLIEGESRFKPGCSRQQMPALYLPISAPGVAEVLEQEPASAIGRTYWMPAQYCFEVPERVREFWVEFAIPKHDSKHRWCDLVGLTVLDADGRIAWRRHFAREDDQVDTVRATVSVPPDQAGRIWRIFVAGQSEGIALDPVIPRVFATSRDRWFRPE